ncbi:CotS family spore coat protein [Anaerobacillus sp. MEB173]|uniref:CotS family spore coat protein n=1 Tax=Anaerobacillus sp. MEB173 TaxID=3383345 RepID=UPI003F916EEA
MKEEQRLITPWDFDDGTVDEFFVPEYIVEMGQEVLKEYDLKVNSMEVITTKGDKGGLIWKIETNQGPKSFKLLHRRPTRSMFSLGAQEYLVVEKKAKVPPIIKTKAGEKWVEAGGKLWFVAEWIEPLEPVGKDLEGAKDLCRAIGEFHRLSKGYQPPEGAEKASRLYRWPKTYKKIANKIDWFKDIAHAYKEMPASSTILDVADMFKEQAEKAYVALEQSAYHELVSRGNKAWGLVHQDYGWSNGQKGPDGMWIIDLDGVAYDLPIRDLQKLITGTMDDLGGWDLHWTHEMIKAYDEANPIDNEMFTILINDLSLPNLFYKNVKEIVFEPTVFMDEELNTLIHRIADNDQSKWPVIEELQKQWKGKSTET